MHSAHKQCIDAAVWQLQLPASIRLHIERNIYDAMTRNLLLLSIFAILGYGFWISPDFRTITAGVAIFLLGMLSLEKGFKSFSGGVLASFLQRTTYAIGIAMTVLMQSSHATPILT